MPRITKITPQRQKGRYNIFIDGEFAFGVDEDTLVSERLKKGQEFTRSEVEQLEKQSDIGKLRQKALRFLETRPRSEFEVRERLNQKIWDNQALFHLRNSAEGQEVVQAVVDSLKALGYLDDREFAKWWVQQRRLSKNPKGKRLIRAELKNKGVDGEVITDVLATTALEMPSGGISAGGHRGQGGNEEGLAMKAAQRRLKAYRKLSPGGFRQKMSAYLIRRGFAWDVVSKVVADLLDTWEVLA